MNLRVGCLLSLFVAATSCGGDLDPASRIQGLRVMALRAQRVLPGEQCGKPAGETCLKDGSWAHPGDRVRMTLLYSDTRPSDAPRSWMWTTCLNPPSSTVLGCFQKLGRDLAASGGAAGGAPKLPGGCDKPTHPCLEQRVGARAKAFDLDPSFEVTVPPDALSSLSPAGRRGAILGVVFLACPGTIRFRFEALSQRRNELPIECLDEAGNPLGTDKFTIGLRRVFLREKDENKDPTIASVTLDGKPWGESDVMDVRAMCGSTENRFDRCDGEHQIGVHLAPDVIESGTDELGVDFTEQVILQYYATEGVFEYDVKRAQEPQTKFAGRRDKLGEHKLWIVIRDNRGGVSWIERKFRVK